MKGVQFVGTLPQALQTWIGFADGGGANAPDPKAARDLLRFMTAPAAAAVLGKAGVEPSVE